MNYRKGITLLETVFIILFIFIALGLLMPVLNPTTEFMESVLSVYPI